MFSLLPDVSHIYDLKVFCKNTMDMERIRQLIAHFMKYIMMDIGLDKCVVVHIVKGKIIDSQLIKCIPLLSSKDSYRYFGLIQCDGIIHDKVKGSTQKIIFIEN